MEMEGIEEIFDDVGYGVKLEIGEYYLEAEYLRLCFTYEGMINGNNVVVATMKVSLFNQDWSNYNFLDVVDRNASGDSMFELMEAYLKWNETRVLLENESEWERDSLFCMGTIALIDRLEVVEEYRHMGIGTILLAESLAMMEKLNVHYFLLKAYPIEIKDFQENRHRQEFCDNYFIQLRQLVSFYKKNGFQLLMELADDLDQNVYMHKFIREK